MPISQMEKIKKFVYLRDIILCLLSRLVKCYLKWASEMTGGSWADPKCLEKAKAANPPICPLSRTGGRSLYFSPAAALSLLLNDKSRRYADMSASLAGDHFLFLYLPRRPAEPRLFHRYRVQSDPR